MLTSVNSGMFLTRESVITEASLAFYHARIIMVLDPVHTSPERVCENGAKMSPNVVAFTRYRIEIV